MARKPQLTPRKRAVQERSRATVDAILEAAAQVLAKRGYAAGTTNRIAARAGVSIGSLYEYFPNKDSILLALVERHLADGTERVLAQLARGARSEEGTRGLLRRFVSAMVDLHSENPELHRVLFEEAPHPPQSHACSLRLEEQLAHTLERALRDSTEVAIADTDTAAHLIVQTVEALAHRFVLHGLHDLRRKRFVAEVTQLCARYLEV